MQAAVMKTGRLQGKRALVTGAAGGIGQAIIRQLRAEGACIAVADRATDAFDALDADVHLPGDRWTCRTVRP